MGGTWGDNQNQRPDIASRAPISARPDALLPERRVTTNPLPGRARWAIPLGLRQHLVRKEKTMWRETHDGQHVINMGMVERLSIEEVKKGRHHDDRYMVTAYLPSGGSFELSAHRMPDEARDALRELIG